MGRKYLMAKTIMITETMFIQNPVLTISDIFIYPELNTIAFGGVATGNMKAQLAARQDEIINPYG
jgi:hypothetical protein